MSEKKYPKGIMIFKPHENAPDFVKGSVVITPKDLVEWFKENADAMTEYKGNKQFRFVLKEGNKGLYLELDTYKPKAKEEKDDDLPW